MIMASDPVALTFPSVMLGCAPLEGRLIVADAGRLVGLIGLELDLPEVARVVADTGRVCTLPEDELPAPVEPSTPRAADDTCLTPELGRTLAADAAQDEFAGAERSECAEAGLAGRVGVRGRVRGRVRAGVKVRGDTFSQADPQCINTQRIHTKHIISGL